MEYRLLGPFEIWDGQRLLAPPPGKPRALLCLLALNVGDVVPTDVLIEALWNEQPPATAQNALQGYVSQLRRLLGKDSIRTQPPGYLLALGDGDSIDLERAEALAELGRAELAERRPERAASRLAEALALWRGTPLVDFRYESFAQGETARIEELRLTILEDRLETELALGRHGELVGELEVLVGEHPLRERLRGQLMLALYRAGRQAEALDAYQRARRVLVEELGIEPGPELKELNRAILNQEVELAPALPATRTSLPSPATPLIGRERELAELQAQLDRPDVRLVTLTGAGGTGKTRLALEVAAELESQGVYPDGVWFVDLQALRNPALVIGTVAQALGAKEELSDYIRAKEVLVMLDNFEQVVDAAPDIGALLSACRKLNVLVTSREPLHLSGEHEFPVEPLPEADAVALFHVRARAVLPSFSANGAVAEICRRLDGLPLAIELAAARTKALSPDAILERLEHRFDLLTGGARDAPERQRTLRATIEWSYEHLSDDEQLLFRRLAVFAGGCTLAAAEEVCGADVDGLQSLVEKNLLSLEGDRFCVLETIREYAAERLDESGEAFELGRRHAESLANLAEQAWPALRTSEQALWLDRLESETGNLRAALTWSLEGPEPEPGLRLCSALASSFWFHRGYYVEAGRWLEIAISRLAGVPPIIQARVLKAAGRAAFFLDDFEKAQALAERALATARECGDRATAARVLLDLGDLARERGEQEGVELEEEALALSRDLGDKFLILDSLHHLADSLRDLGDLARARELFEESIRLAREGGDLLSAAGTMHSLGDLALDAGELDRAEELYRESLDLARQLDAKVTAAYCLAGLASVAAARGAFERAARLWGVTEAREDDLGFVVLAPSERGRYERLVRPACEGEPAALAAGRELDPEEALELALHS